MPELADWVRGIALLGWDGENFIPILLDDLGNLNVYMQGEIAPGEMHMIRVDDDGRMITKLRGRDGNYLVVDDAGFMTAVIKAKYGEELITVKADEAGRLSAFIIDSTDAWDNLLKVGNAELAARIGSLMSYDGRGQYQYGYDFSNGLTSWHTQALGGLAEVKLTPETYERGGYSVSLVGGNSTPWQSTCWRMIDVMESKTFGLEVGVSIASSIDWVNILATYYDGVNYHTAGIKYDDTQNLLRCRITEPDWQTFATNYQMFHNASAYHAFKFVWNIDTGKYVRALIAGHYYDLSSYSILSDTSPTKPYMDFSVTVQSRDGYNDAVNWDYVIVTNQE